MNYEMDLEKVGRDIFPFYLGLLFIAPIPFGANRPWAWAILAICAFALLLFYVWHYARQNLRPPELTNDIRLILLLLILWLAYQIFQLIPLPVSILEFFSPQTVALKQMALGASTDIRFLSLSFDVSAGLRSIIKTILYISLFALTLFLVQSRDRLRLLILTIIFIGVAQAVWGMSVAFMQEKILLGGEPANILNVVKGTFVNRNHFGGFINLSIAAVIALLLSSGLREKRRIHREKLSHHWQSRALDWRMYLVPYLGILFVALMFSESRGAMFSLAFMVIVMVGCLIYFKIGVAQIYKKFQLIIWLIVFVVIFSGADMLSTRFMTIDDDISLRLNHWQNSLKIFSDFSFFGVGAGNFQYLYPLYDSGYDKYRLLHAHNDYIEILVEQGLIGFSLIAAVVLLSIKNAIQAIRHFQHIHQAAFAVGSLIAIGGFLFHSTVEFNFQIPSNAIYFFVFLAIALLQGMRSVHEEKRETVWDEETFSEEDSQQHY